VINTDDQHVLYIEPQQPPSDMPVIDGLTRKMAAALRQAEMGTQWLGFHGCTGCDKTGCDIPSSSCDYVLPNGLETNSLCIHYLAYHRDEVPTSEKLKVMKLGCGEADPTDEELAHPPEARHFKTREEVQQERTDFIRDYCAERGWDNTDLTVEQFEELKRAGKGKV